MSQHVDLDDLLYDTDGTVGRVCHPCGSALEKLGKIEELNKSIREDISNAIAVITNEGQAQELQHQDSCGPTPARCHLNLSSSGDGHVQIGSNNARSPDVSVSLYVIINHKYMYMYRYK